MTSRFRTITTLALLGLSFAFAAPAHATKVIKAKGKKVLVDSEGDTLEVGQIFLVKNADGKSVGIIKLTKVSRGKAVAILGKGTAEPGFTLVPKKAKGGGDAPPEPVKASNSKRMKAPAADQAYWGAMAGLSMSSAKIKLFDDSGNSAGSASLTGNGFNAKAMYDYPLFSLISFRGLAGIEQFNVGGKNSTACGANGASAECIAEITYLTIDFWGRYMFNKEGDFRFWAGAGGSIIFPMSKKSTAIKEDSISTSNLFAFGGGMDYYLNPSTYIPVQIEYQLYPKSTNVDATAITIRAGYAIPW